MSCLDVLKKDYIQHLQLKGYTPLTLRQTEQMIRIFMNFLKSQGLTDIKKLTKDHLEEYKKYLSSYQTKKRNKLTSTTIVVRLRVVRCFMKYLAKNGIIYRDISEGWRLPKVKSSLPRGIMSVPEINRIMKQPKLKTTLGYRDRTILEVLYSTGVRAGELINLKVNDVDLEKKVLRVVKGKGNKDRFVLLNTPTCRFLSRYIEKIRPVLLNCPRPHGNNWETRSKTGENILFLTVYGGKLTNQGLTVILKKYIEQAGIEKEVAPCHSFRHSVATHLLESGMDVRYVQVFLGHETIQTTEIYTHVEKEKLREMLRKYHPQEVYRNDIEIKRFKDTADIPLGSSNVSAI